jgi:hypothetical protein
MVTTLPNPDSRIALLALANGLVALAFNDHQRPMRALQREYSASEDGENATVVEEVEVPTRV